MSQSLKIKIISSEADQRLDKFLSTYDFSKLSANITDEFSRGDFIRAIQKREILVNDKQVKPSYKINLGDIIEIKSSFFQKSDELFANSDIHLDIVFADEHLIAVNKPADLQVHPDHNEKSETLINGLLSLYPEISKVKDSRENLSDIRPGIVHRLDKDTSGILIVARTIKAFRELKQLFQKREIRKKYLAIVYGKPKEKSGIIDKPLAKTSNYRRQTIAGKKTKTKIREAVTEYKVVEEISDKFSLLEVYPKTGRTHQIRVHLFSIGHPIVGDKLYKLKNISPVKDVSRQLLHAHKIDFNLFNKKYSFSAEPPEDFKKFLLSYGVDSG